MTSPPHRHAALDDILSRVRHLLIEFDGPVCTPETGNHAADQLRAILTTSGAQLPEPVAKTGDPLAVLAHAATLNAQLAQQAEAELTRQELAAAVTAKPAGYSHDLLASARESNRTVTVISTRSARAVGAYLDRASLTDLVVLVVGRQDTATGPNAGQDTISRAIAELAAEPATCAVLATSPDILTAATTIGIATIAYAPAPVPGIATTAAQITITSLADLVLRLRAHPLPN